MTTISNQPLARKGSVGAAEVLHRGLGIDERSIPADEFKPMREAMLAHVPEDHRERFKGAIRNDPTLRDRLYALAARPDNEAVALLMPDVDRSARRTTRVRNDLAHKGRTLNHSVEELIAVVEGFSFWFGLSVWQSSPGSTLI